MKENALLFYKLFILFTEYKFSKKRKDKIGK